MKIQQLVQKVKAKKQSVKQYFKNLKGTGKVKVKGGISTKRQSLTSTADGAKVKNNTTVATVRPVKYRGLPPPNGGQH